MSHVKMADEAPVIPEPTQEIPMETSVSSDLSTEKQIEPDHQQSLEPMVQEVASTSEKVISEEDQKSTEVTPEQGAVASTLQEPVADETPSEAELPKAEEPPPKRINVFVKTPQEKESFEINENAGVKDFKQLIAPKFNAEPDQLVLIFAGKIMDDSDNMQQHKVKDGLTIHLVIRTAETGSPRQSADISATPYGLGNLGGLVGLAQLGMGSPNFMELQNQMQNELLTNPNVLRNLLENPLVQELMTHTDVLRTLIMRNPQMQELIDR